MRSILVALLLLAPLVFLAAPAHGSSPPSIVEKGSGPQWWAMRVRLDNSQFSFHLTTWHNEAAFSAAPWSSERPEERGIYLSVPRQLSLLSHETSFDLGNSVYVRQEQLGSFEAHGLKFDLRRSEEPAYIAVDLWSTKAMELTLMGWVSGSIGNWNISIDATPGTSYALSTGDSAYLYTPRDFQGPSSVGVLSEGYHGAVVGLPVEKRVQTEGNLVAVYHVTQPLRLTGMTARAGDKSYDCPCWFGDAPPGEYSFHHSGIGVAFWLSVVDYTYPSLGANENGAPMLFSIGGQLPKLETEVSYPSRWVDVAAHHTARASL